MAISDIDRNGYPDLFCLRWKSPGYSRVYLNQGGIFKEISSQTPLEALENVEINTTSALWVDYDNDGDPDLIARSAVLRNDNGANWIGFILEGTVSNRDAVGSLVTLYTRHGKQRHYTTCGDGFLRQGNPWVHFGIGFAATIASVVIRWPLGYRQDFSIILYPFRGKTGRVEQGCCSQDQPY